MVLKIMSSIIKKPDGIILKIYVQPKASNNAVVGIHDDAIKIRLTAPPIDGEANKMCVKFLAKQLGIPKTSIDIISGQTSRTKQVFIRFANEQAPSYQEQSESMMNRIENLIQLKKP